MNMKNLLLLLSVLFTASLMGQNAAFLHADGEPITDTLVFSYLETDPYLDDHANLTYYEGSVDNLTDGVLRTIMSREIISYAADSAQEVDWFGDTVWVFSGDQLCWGTGCYNYGIEDGFIELDGDMEANQSIALDIVTHYTHRKIVGTTIIKYQISSGGVVEDELIMKFEILEDNGSGTAIAEKTNTFNIYPNPCINNVTLSNLENVKSVEVSNILGQMVYRNTSVGSDMELSTSDFEEGLYFVRIVDFNDDVQTERLIKR